MILLAAAAAMVVTTAQDEPVGTAGSQKDAELAMARFATCEVKSIKGRDAALAFTREVEGTPSDYPKRLVRSSCAERGTSLRFQPTLFRMALFPALYARDYGKSESADLSAVAQPDHAREFDGTPSEQTLMMRAFGDCVVRRDAAGSRRLVLSKLYSPEEAAALVAVRPVLGQCVADGQQLRFSRSIVHGAIGEALYKLTAAHAATKAG